MKFHLEFPIQPFKEKINYRDKLLFIGSCFAENIEEILYAHKFNTIINPNGIIYNPASIAIAIRRYIKNDFLKIKELFYTNECWNSWEHHSNYSRTDKEGTLEFMNSEIAATNE